MVKSVAKARKRFDEQIEKSNKSGAAAQRGHGGLAGRPNLNALGPSDPEVLRSWKCLGLFGVCSHRVGLDQVGNGLFKVHGCPCWWQVFRSHRHTFLG